MQDFTQAPDLLSGVKQVHFIGCGGSGMYPLVQILAAKGYTITGSDVLEGDILNYERALGVTVHLGHKAENIQGADLVVYSAAIAHNNIEVQTAETEGIRTVERSILLGHVSRMFADSVCVAGTHGKTTATAMITTALVLAGRDPSAVIGGKLPLIGGYGKCGAGENIVIEACEFSETFLELSPAYSILLNVDNDHLDYFGDMEHLKFAFQKFLQLTGKTMFANADDEKTMEVAAKAHKPLLTFGIHADCDYKASNITQHKPGFYAFDLTEGDTVTGHIALSAPGYHNIYNALAMCAVCRTIGLTGAECAAAAADFKGAGRRFEIYGECNGAVIVDDYAHHPTELRAVLTTAKTLGFDRLVAVHQPFTYSRTKTLMDDFAEVLQIADVTLLTPILGSREIDDGSVCSADLAAKIPGALVLDSLPAAADWVKANCKKGDLVITIGCGDVYKAGKMMVAED
ncbi:MAG: UDP-N-acetylmuramate--L-alanine ligase [Faecalibacterium sp.]